jgi:hypothetical protein
MHRLFAATRWVGAAVLFLIAAKILWEVWIINSIPATERGLPMFAAIILVISASYMVPNMAGVVTRAALCLIPASCLLLHALLGGTLPTQMALEGIAGLVLGFLGVLAFTSGRAEAPETQVAHSRFADDAYGDGDGVTED